MSLNESTVTPLIDQWSDVLGAAFTDTEKQSLVNVLITLSGHIVPHIVMDTPLTHDDEQAYLLGQAIARIEDWLTMAAASHRRIFKLDSIRYQTGSEDAALGLKSASHDEIEALPAIGDALAEKIGRFLTRYPMTVAMEDLSAINGIGADRVAALESVAYLEKTSFGFISPSLWAFIMSPDIPTALRLLEHTDFSLIYGDHNLIERRSGTLEGTLYQRFFTFLELVTTRAALMSSPNGGALASEAASWVTRHQLRRDQLNSVEVSNGELLLDDAYVDVAESIINAANQSLELMVFLGTAADSDADDKSPLPLVEAMEAASARGVDVRVILDQDDGGEPYKSFFINKPLVDRFKASGVQVKFDKKDTLLHSKVLVVDNSKTIVGSHNWTRAGFNHTNEMSVLIESVTVATSFHVRFDALWNVLPAN